MVKNTTGGSKAKGQARKFVSEKSNKALRVSEDPLELYAQVTKNLGNGMCHVLCIDNKTRLCHIRGKFRGRGKKDNFIGMGSWILVGLREWEAGKESTGKIANCDLLEVYTDHNKEMLKKIPTHNWSLFTTAHDAKPSAEDEIEFTEETGEEYAELNTTATIKIEVADDEEDFIDINDI